MRLALTPRTMRRPARLPRVSGWTALEFTLIGLVAVQCARLVWTVATPLGPVGEWGAAPVAAPLSAAGLESFDPFFRLSASSGAAVVTSLDLTLHGIREDRATGRGSAILGLPGGEQSSFAVGEEVLPGVVLHEVGFDSVTLLKGGAREQLFLDQSAPAEPSGAPAAPAPAPAAASAAPVEPPIRFQPRSRDGRVNGVVVQPGSSGDAFRAAGFAPGDVIVSVNGEPVTSAEQARALAGRSGSDVALVVERGGRAVPMRVRFQK